MRTVEEVGHVRNPLFQHMSSLGFKVQLSDERVNRIRRVVSLEQLAASAMAPDETQSVKARAQRLRFWAEQARRHGWPDGMVAG